MLLVVGLLLEVIKKSTTTTAQELIIDMLFIALTQASRPGRKLLERTNEVVSQFRQGNPSVSGS